MEEIRNDVESIQTQAQLNANETTSNSNEVDALKSKLLQQNGLIEQLATIINDASSSSHSNAASDVPNEILSNLKSVVDQLTQEMASMKSNVGLIEEETDYTYRIVDHSYLRSCDENSFHFLNCKYNEYFGKYNQVPLKRDLPMKPGDCMPLSNRNSEFAPYIVIELYKKIRIKEVAVIHFAPNWLPLDSIGSAPKQIEIEVSNDNKDWIYVGKMFYDYNGASLQRFELKPWDYPNKLLYPPEKQLQIEEMQYQRLNDSYKFVNLTFMSNGGADYTCIYRVHVYGELVE